MCWEPQGARREPGGPVWLTDGGVMLLKLAGRVAFLPCPEGCSSQPEKEKIPGSAWVPPELTLLWGHPELS